MTTTKQQIRVTTAAGATDYDADVVLVQDGQYVLMYEGSEVARVPISDVVSSSSEDGESSSGIETVFSRT